MKELKVKSQPQTVSNGMATFQQKNLQATEEQIRYAKLSQLSSKDEGNIQEKMKEVSEITRKPPNVVSLALHDCSYDTAIAIQNILEGLYDDPVEDEWITTKQTKKSKKAAAAAQTGENHTESSETDIDKLCNDFGPTDTEEPKQTPNSNRLSRGAGRGGGRGGRNNISYSDNWDNEKSPPEEKSFRDSSEKPFRERGRTNDRSRGRGRGRGRSGMRGNERGGMRRGRGGFSRGGRGGFYRGSNNQNRGGFSRGRDSNDRRQEMNENETVNYNTPAEESWDVDSPGKIDGAADWSEETPNAIDQSDWSKDEPDWEKEDSDWVKENARWTSKDEWANPSQLGENCSPDVDWSQLNGHAQNVDNWQQNGGTPPKDDRLKYLPENIDTAVICSIPNTSSNGQVASYHPNDDISRYINCSTNQLPPTHPQNDISDTLNDRAFSSLASTVRASDDIRRTISAMPMVSGVTESHKLEQQQLRTNKPHTLSKLRKTHRYGNLPNQPVVMPRSARMVNDVQGQYPGLEFGSGPLSPRAAATAASPEVEYGMSSNGHDLTTNILSEIGSVRHQDSSISNETLISHSSSVLAQDSMVTVTSVSQVGTNSPTNQIGTKSEVLKTPPGFKCLDQSASQYLGSPSRSQTHLISEPMPFPSSNSRASPETTLDVFSCNLGTSLVTEQPTPISSNCSDGVYDQQPNDMKTENLEQKALAEKQLLAENPLEQNDRSKPEQKPFSEEIDKVQSKLMNTQLQKNDTQRTPEDLSRTDRLKVDMADQRGILNESQPNLSAQDALKLSKNSASNVQNRMHSSSPVTNQMNNIPKTCYSSTEILNNLTSTTGIQAAKIQQTGKSTNAPPGVLPMNLYAGVQPGLVSLYQQQAMPGYSYDELLQMGRVPMPPYTYDVSMFPAVAPPASARESIQAYQNTTSKFNRGTDETSNVNIPQGAAHVAPGNLPTQQQAAYLNATGQLPYGYTYAYQPNVMPQGGVYPAFTTQSMYQMAQCKGTQYPSQFQSAQQQQQGYSLRTTANDSSKANFHHTNAAGQVGLPTHSKETLQNSSSTSSLTTIQSGAGFKSQYTQNGKGFPLNSPTSLTAQHGLHHIHNPAAQHYLVQQHTNLSSHSGQLSASHIGHPQMDLTSHRSPVHQIPPFAGNRQKRDTKDIYSNNWFGNP